jgi:hypothetical protein
VRRLGRVIQFAGKVGVFGFRVLIDAAQPPFELAQVSRQLAEIGNKSIVLIVVSGFALEAVMTLHTRNTLVTFGDAAMKPAVQAVSFLVEKEWCEAPQSPTHVDFNILSLACTPLHELLFGPVPVINVDTRSIPLGDVPTSIEYRNFLVQHPATGTIGSSHS